MLEGRIDRDSTAGIRAAIDRAFPANLVVDELNRGGELGVAGTAPTLPEVSAYEGPFDQDRPDDGDGPVEWMAAVYTAVVAVTHEAFSRVSNECEAALDASRVEAPDAKLALETLRFFYDRYESYDQALLPVWSAFDGELDVVDVMRVSPFDANALFDEEKLGEPGNPAKKLAGVRFGHFGGFLDRRWRRSDLMWGRLDGAERLIEALLEPGAERTELIRAAQLAIVREELPAPSGLADLIYRQLLDGDDRGDRDAAGPSRRRARSARAGGDQQPADAVGRARQPRRTPRPARARRPHDAAHRGPGPRRDRRPVPGDDREPAGAHGVGSGVGAGPVGDDRRRRRRARLVRAPARPLLGIRPVAVGGAVARASASRSAVTASRRPDGSGSASRCSSCSSSRRSRGSARDSHTANAPGPENALSGSGVISQEPPRSLPNGSFMLRTPRKFRGTPTPHPAEGDP